MGSETANSKVALQENCGLRGLNLGWEAKNVASPSTRTLPIRWNKRMSLLFFSLTPPIPQIPLELPPEPLFPIPHNTHPCPKQAPHKMAHSLPPIGLRYLRHYPQNQGRAIQEASESSRQPSFWALCQENLPAEASGSTPNTHSEMHTPPKAGTRWYLSINTGYTQENTFTRIPFQYTGAHTPIQVCPILLLHTHLPQYLSLSHKPLPSSHT